MNPEFLSLEDLSQFVQNLDKDLLLLHTQSLVAKERELTAKTLVMFREIENRMIHLEMGFGSLFDMLVNYFKFSEGCASRRVASVRLISQLPEVEQKIRNGDLSMSNVAAAQRFFNAEKKNNNPLGKEEKKEVLDSLVGKTTREAEAELLQRSSVPLNLQVPDQVKSKGEDHVEIRFLAPAALVDLLEEAKGLLAHRLPKGTSMADVIGVLAEMGIEKVKKERFGVGCKPKKQSGEGETIESMNAEEKILCADVKAEVDVSSVSDMGERSRYIPVEVRREVFLRADGKCEYVDEKTGRRCGATQFLEFDHQKAFALGGEHTVDCLQITCRAHNRFRAVNDFGEWVNKYRANE